MPKGYALSERAAEILKRFFFKEARTPRKIREHYTLPGVGSMPIVVGVIDGEMRRESRQTMRIFTLNETGFGLDENTDLEISIQDFGQIETGTVLPRFCKVTAGFCMGQWVLLSYDCDLEGTSVG